MCSNKQGARTFNGCALSGWVYSEIFDVLEPPNGTRVVIGRNGLVTAAVVDSSLIKV
ncbi:MAG: hypothetical protein LBC82_07090 [Oscillospiraceae bacterium]|nr:hypothetical protein [Oscillospiraceae bacterium]